ncbi:MAG: hypothetical protein JXL84_12885 [Deltaproteobacteria bacterium]|nr:hypothetical protein [Deltaproteobacteria bacterium]
MRKVIAEQGKELSLSFLSGEIASRAHPPEAGSEEELLLEEVENRHICRVLASVGGNRTRAARILGIGPRALQRKINIP